MAKNLLAIVKAAVLEMGLAAPVTVVGNPDGQTLQMMALANRVGTELAQQDHGWEALRGEQLITMVPGTDTYAFPADFGYYMPETMWNRGARWPVAGPVSASGWQLIKSGLWPSGFYSRFRVMDGAIVFDPVPTAAGTIAIEYMSNAWCQSATGTRQIEFLADTDIPVIPDDLLVLGLKWQFKAAKGFDFSVEKMAFDTACARLQPRDFVPETVNMRGGGLGVGFLNPGLFPNAGYPV